MVVEKKLSELPNITAKGSIPNRRVDLLVYSQDGKPLVLIECKASKITQSAVRQVLAYNVFVGAKAVVLVNEIQEFCVIGGRQYPALPQWRDLHEL